MEFTELDKLLDQASALFSSIDSRLYSRIVNQSSSRPSLMNTASQSLKSMSHRLNSFGPHPVYLVEEGSSDEGSIEEKSFPSIRQVTESILDSQYTTITVLVT